jgi:hypothetical protein
MTVHVQKADRVAAICACGCGNPVEQKAGAGRPRRWCDGHRPGSTKERMCICGCGEPVVRTSARGALPKYAAGHSPTDKKYPSRRKAAKEPDISDEPSAPAVSPQPLVEESIE